VVLRNVPRLIACGAAGASTAECGALLLLAAGGSLTGVLSIVVATRTSSRSRPYL
jgi:hypothetical protein